ncbi:unnamed protein product, partial [Mycena citricolor]
RIPLPLAPDELSSLETIGIRWHQTRPCDILSSCSDQACLETRPTSRILCVALLDAATTETMSAQVGNKGPRIWTQRPGAPSRLQRQVLLS